MSGARTAFAFLTRIPVGDPGPLTPRAMSGAAAWFPVVGLAVGAVAGGVHALAGLAFEPTAATALALLAAVLVTGALHEDGLADFADAAIATASRERRHEILHDSRVGTYGALALVFATVLALALLHDLDDKAFLETAVAAHVLGRWSSVALARFLPRALPEGAGTLLGVSTPALLAATAVAVATAAFTSLPFLAAALATTAVGGIWAVRALGGVTGDAFGATNKLVELTVYAVAAAQWA